MTKIYPVGLAGESKYQGTISTCSPGERVFVCHEPDNPYDDLALRVETGGGQVIGYIPKSSWLRGAIHDEGRGATCTIASIKDAGSGVFGVVINATLTDDDTRVRQYQAAPPASAGTVGSVARGFLGGLIRGLRG